MVSNVYVESKRERERERVVWARRMIQKRSNGMVKTERVKKKNKKRNDAKQATNPRGLWYDRTSKGPEVDQRSRGGPKVQRWDSRDEQRQEKRRVLSDDCNARSDALNNFDKAAAKNDDVQVCHRRDQSSRLRLISEGIDVDGSGTRGDVDDVDEQAEAKIKSVTRGFVEVWVTTSAGRLIITHESRQWRGECGVHR
jgi:hypothetical protein